MANRQLRAGIVGLGHRGKKHLKTINNVENVELAWIYDPGDLNKEDFDFTKRLLNYSEFQDNPVDFVIVSVPHNEYINIIEILGSGCTKFILKEKPVASSLKEAYEIKYLEGKLNLNICIAAQRRFSKSIQFIKKQLEVNGPPLDFSYKYYLGLSVDKLDLNDWRENKELAGGGAIMDMGYHAIDLITYLLGTPKDITCYLRKPVKEARVESGGLINFSYDHTYGSIYMERFLSPKEEELSFHWRNFSLKLVNNELFLIKDNQKELIVSDNSTSILELQLEEFIKCVKGMNSEVCDLPKAIDTIETIERCYWNSRWLSTGSMLKEGIIN